MRQRRSGGRALQACTAVAHWSFCWKGRTLEGSSRRHGGKVDWSERASNATKVGLLTPRTQFPTFQSKPVPRCLGQRWGGGGLRGVAPQNPSLLCPGFQLASQCLPHLCAPTVSTRARKIPGPRTLGHCVDLGTWHGPEQGKELGLLPQPPGQPLLPSLLPLWWPRPPSGLLWTILVTHPRVMAQSGPGRPCSKLLAPLCLCKFSFSSSFSLCLHLLYPFSQFRCQISPLLGSPLQAWWGSRSLLGF